MAQNTKRPMYPKAEEGRGAGTLDFSQAFKTSHLGEVLCNANPMQEKFLKQQWDDLDKAKRRRENALFHNQRNFFIAQVFGKGLNPHLNRSTEHLDGENDELETAGDNSVLVTKHQVTEEPRDTHVKAVGKDKHNSTSLDNGLVRELSLEIPRSKSRSRSYESLASIPEDNAESMMLTQCGDLGGMTSRSKTGSRLTMVRSQTSGELNVKRGQSPSFPTLTGHSELKHDLLQGFPSRDKLMANFLQEKAKSTSDLADPVSGRPATVYALPSINNINKPVHKPEIIIEEEKDLTTTPDQVSVHTLTDHISLSTRQWEKRKDVSTLRCDPSRIFPKMRMLLSSYDSEPPATFNQIMNLGDDDHDQISTMKLTNRGGKPIDGCLVGRFGSNSARVPNADKHQRIKVKIKSARETSRSVLSAKTADSKCVQEPYSKRASTKSAQGSDSHSNNIPFRDKPQELDVSQLSVSPRKTARKRDVRCIKSAVSRSTTQSANYTRSVQQSLNAPRSVKVATQKGQRHLIQDGSKGLQDEHLTVQNDVDIEEDVDSPKELSETQKYVKMIQQLMAYLPEHLLATAEDQIRKMSNTDQIMKFKHRMIEKNHEVIEKDSRTDPRWRRLEGTLVRGGNTERWYKRYSAWHLNNT